MIPGWAAGGQRVPHWAVGNRGGNVGLAMLGGQREPSGPMVCHRPHRGQRVAAGGWACCSSAEGQLAHRG